VGSDKAKDLAAAVLGNDPKGLTIAEADDRGGALIDAAVAPLLDALEDYWCYSEFPALDVKAKALLRAWGRS
jgi:hypothetical protein